MKKKLNPVFNWKLFSMILLIQCPMSHDSLTSNNKNHNHNNIHNNKQKHMQFQPLFSGSQMHFVYNPKVF